jgi:hypothetical protein
MKDVSNKEGKDTNPDKPEEEHDAATTKLRRRLQDGITSKTATRKMNLDRRRLSDRRGKYDTDYKGPSRRYTLDRRVSKKDRRKNDD